jgi:hypothetical protein
VTTALLDTCVLVPSRARDVLLEIASTGAYRPLWSSEILAELTAPCGSCSPSEAYHLSRPTPTLPAYSGR